MPPKTRRLKLNGPRRRESVRVRARAPSSASPPTTAESPGDTIEVAQKSSDGPVEEALPAPAVVNDAAATSETLVVSDGERPEKMDTEPTPTAQGKEDEAMIDVDDAVTEYDFNDEKESAFDDDEDEDYGKFKDTDVDFDVISISSDDPPYQKDFALDPRPWLSMNRECRAVRERTFCMPPRRPIGGDWQDCEKYLEGVDLEMEEYTKDFPLETWVIGRSDAERGYAQMLERRKMRSVGVPYYQREMLADVSRQTMQMHPPPMPVHRQHSSHHPQSHHQMPLPQQQMVQPPAVHQSATPSGPSQPQHLYFPATQAMVHAGFDEHGRDMYRLVDPQESQQLLQPLSVAPPVRALSQPKPREQPAPSQPKASVQRVPSHSKPPKPRTQVDEAASQLQIQVQTMKNQTGEMLAAQLMPGSSENASNKPPYPTRLKPSLDPASQQKNKRKLGETGEFPWNRQIDFEGAKAQVSWCKKDLYDPVTVNKMDEVRNKNAEYIGRAKLDDSAKNRKSNMAKTSDGLDLSSDDDRLKQQAKQADNAGESCCTTTDNSIMGSFQYVSDVDRQNAEGLREHVFGQKSRTLPDGQYIETIMEAAGKPGLDEPILHRIKICWHPTKKAHSQELEKVKLSIRDSLRTRKQLAITPVLNKDAAECIIDFCPDLLFHGFLLRILSETSITNKQLRDRLCQNGGWIDKATITKRTGSALGKKQYTKAGEGARDDEERYYLENAKDFENYQLFFGKDHSRLKNRVDLSGMAKRLKRDDGSSSAISSRPSSSGSNGSVMVVNGVSTDGGAKNGMQTRSLSSSKGKGKVPMRIPQLDGADDDVYEEMDVKGEGSEIEVAGGRMTMDEVSVQSDGELDRLLGDDSD